MPAVPRRSNTHTQDPAIPLLSTDPLEVHDVTKARHLSGNSCSSNSQMLEGSKCS